MCVRRAGLTLLFAVVVADTTFACICSVDSVEEVAVADMVAEADAVFLGRPVSRVDADWFFPDAADPWPGYAWTFDVRRAWKGDVGHRTVVVTGTARGDCGYPFVADHEYIVYAYESDGTLYTHLCTWNVALDDPAADQQLEALDALSIVYITKPASVWPTAAILAGATFLLGIASTVLYHRLWRRP